MYVKDTWVASEWQYWTWLRELVKERISDLTRQFETRGHGWQFVMEVAMKKPNDSGVRFVRDTRDSNSAMWTKFYLHLADGEGGDYVIEKRNTLILFPGRLVSSCDNVYEVLNALEHAMKKDVNSKVEPMRKLKEIRDVVAKYKDVADIPGSLNLAMRDAYGIVFLPGALRIPFIYGREEDEGEILLSFDGLPSSLHDLFVVDTIFHQIRTAVAAMGEITLLDGNLVGRSELRLIEAIAKNLAEAAS